MESAGEHRVEVGPHSHSGYDGDGHAVGGLDGGGYGLIPFGRHLNQDTAIVQFFVVFTSPTAHC